MDLDLDGLRGFRVDYLAARVRPIRTYPVGRSCRVPGCGTTLSQYNPGDRCWRHADPPYEERAIGSS